MKKQFKRALSVLVLFVACLSYGYAQGNLLIDSNSKSEASEENISQGEIDFTQWGIHYAADLDYIDKGMYGLFSHFLRHNKVGYSLSINSSVFIADTYSAAVSGKIGPNYSYALSDKLCFYIPLYLNILNQSYPTYEYIDNGRYSYTKEGSKHKWHWGFELAPSLALKLGMVTLNVGMQLDWIEGGDEITTAGIIGIGFGI